MRSVEWFFFFFSSRRRHTRCSRDWSSDVCSSDLPGGGVLLSTTRCAADGASGSAAGAVGGGQETPGLETALPDSRDRSDPVRRTEIGRGSGRGRVEISGVGGSFKKKKEESERGQR